VKINVMTPYALDKNLGRAYNEAMSMIGEDDWGCLIDYDVQFLTPGAVRMLYEYAGSYPDTLLTCLTNRIHPCNRDQLYRGTVSNVSDMCQHMEIAERLAVNPHTVTELTQHLSGFLMLLSKRVWNEIKFTEDLKCLGVDTDYFDRLQTAGKKVYRMNSLYVFHTYRLMTGIKNKAHLL
jgi:GT2 family glycosyltransferase